jgi:hypothetical protein
VKKILYGFLAFIFAGLLAWYGVARFVDYKLKEHDAQQAIAKRDSSIATLDSSRIVRDTVYLRGRTVFREVAANPASTKPEIIRACTEALNACDVVRATNDSLRDSLKAQVGAWRKMKGKKPPRLSLSAAALYDFVNKQTLGRVGVDFRVVGPLSVTTEIEAAPQSNYSFKSRAVAGVRFTFR